MAGRERSKSFGPSAKGIDADKEPADPLLTHGGEGWLQIVFGPRGQHPQVEVECVGRRLRVFGIGLGIWIFRINEQGEQCGLWDYVA